MSIPEELSLALVREYLNKKGYKKALATLHDELVRLYSPPVFLKNIYYFIRWGRIRMSWMHEAEGKGNEGDGFHVSVN